MVLGVGFGGSAIVVDGGMLSGYSFAYQTTVVDGDGLGSVMVYLWYESCQY